MGEENEQQFLLFPMFWLSRSLTLFQTLLSPDADEIESAGLFLFCHGASQFFLFIVSVCSIQGYALILFSQRIRHAEC